MFATVPLTALIESPTNPRRHFNETDLGELAASVREKGVLVPLLVRALPEGPYEIVCGARRYRAATRAGLEEIPVRIVDFDDKQTLEVQVIENLQRADVHPLEEARAYRLLIDAHGHDVAGIAAKVGKSESYVYKRLALTRLVPEVQAAFERDCISAGHAAIIATLEPVDQGAALEHAVHKDWLGNTPGTRDLKRWIEHNLQMRLKEAPFPLKDSKLGALPCLECPKNTANQPELFEDPGKEAKCGDRRCFEAKIDVWIERYVAKGFVQLSDEYGVQPPEGVLGQHQWRCHGEGCKEKGIFVDGYKRGQVVKFSRQERSAPKSDYELAKETKRHAEVVRSLFVSVLDAGASKALPREARAALIKRIFRRQWHDGKKRLCLALGWISKGSKENIDQVGGEKIDAMTEPELDRFLTAIALCEDMVVPAHGARELSPEMAAVAKALEIDVKAVRKAALASLDTPKRGKKEAAA